MECKYCKHSFSSKNILANHQKSARYCLKIQNKEFPVTHTCEGCKKSFTIVYDLNTHRSKCKASSTFYEFQQKIENLQKELVDVRKELDDVKKELDVTIQQKDIQLASHAATIKELQDKLENIALKAVSRPTTSKTQINKTQNNYIQNMQPITDEHLRDNLQYLSIEHILKGAEGYAQYALEYPLKDRILCVDYARRKIKFKHLDGTIIMDPEMDNLSTKFFSVIKDKNKELIMQYGEERKDNFGEALDTICKLLDYKVAVDQGSEGKKSSDFHHDFVKQICNKTLRS